MCIAVNAPQTKTLCYLVDTSWWLCKLECKLPISTACFVLARCCVWCQYMSAMLVRWWPKVKQFLKLTRHLFRILERMTHHLWLFKTFVEVFFFFDHRILWAGLKLTYSSPPWNPELYSEPGFLRRWPNKVIKITNVQNYVLFCNIANKWSFMFTLIAVIEISVKLNHIWFSPQHCLLLV